MKIRVTLEIDDDARRGLSESAKPASRADVAEEILAVWSAHCDDLRDRFSEQDAVRKSWKGRE